MKKNKKKIVLGFIVVVVIVVLYLGVSNCNILSVMTYFGTTKDIDFKVDYVIKAVEEKNIPKYLQEGTLTGELRGVETEESSVHGYLYLKDNEVPIIEYYENEVEMKYNIGQLCIYMIEKIDDTTGIPLDWLSNSITNYYITQEQLEQIIGREIGSVLASTEIKKLGIMETLFVFKKTDMPLESVFEESINKMKFYNCADNGYHIVIGVPNKFGDNSNIYIKISDERNVVECMLSCKKVKNGELIQIPEGQLSEKTVETIQWIYEKFVKLQENLKK